MKTKERILLTSLALFNEHGENGVTSVDIAMELDISPGNLYYHYKGKEQIIKALLQMHQAQMTKILKPYQVVSLSAEDVFYYLHIVIEQLHVFRFFYRSQADIGEKYPSVKRTHQSITSALATQLGALFKQMVVKGLFNASSAEQRLLVELVSVILMQSCQQDGVYARLDEEAQRYHALSLVMVSLLPRLNVSKEHLDEISTAIDSHTMANLSSHVSTTITELKD